MKQNVVPAGLARLAASLAAALVLTVVQAPAAERAQINFIGYSEDARYFAFEEYGVTDGAGGNYDHIYVVDLSNDSWVKGTPILLEEGGDTDETPPLAGSRAKAMAKAAPILRQLKIDVPATIVALNGDGMHVDRKVLDFFTPNCCGVDTTEDTDFKLTLTTFHAKGAEEVCNQIAEDGPGIVGFALTLDAEGVQTELHRDGAQLPKSRGCTLDYAIYAVVNAFEGSWSRVAIIASWPFGFEGPDRRFLAVPIDDWQGGGQ